MLYMPQRPRNLSVRKLSNAIKTQCLSNEIIWKLTYGMRLLHKNIYNLEEDMS